MSHAEFAPSVRNSSLALASGPQAMSQTFEDLRAFQRALELMVNVYEATAAMPKAELYGLTSQLRRASSSVVSHIAEGQGRLTFGEWRQMLSQARGSLYEVQAQVLAAEKLGFFGCGTAEHLKKQARIAGRELAGLIAWVRRREIETNARLSETKRKNRTREGAG